MILKKELEGLPKQIEILEAEQGGLHASLAAPGFYRGQGDEVVSVKTRLAELERELPAVYAKWEELEARKDL